MSTQTGAVSQLDKTDCPLVSVVVPCRNEGNYVRACLSALLAQEYPTERTEILLVDGLSTDGTREIAEEYAREHPSVRVLSNPDRITPIALNVGVKGSRGSLVIILGCHSRVSPDFLRRNVNALKEHDADCVGGVLLTRPADESATAEAIALALSNSFGVGNAQFRTGAGSVRRVDTVPFGCYRREVFDRIGYFDEELVRNQDDEFNLRLIRRGGRILLVPDIVTTYYPRNSVPRLWRMYWQYGLFKPLVARKVQGILTWRQLVPPAFVLSLPVCAVAALLWHPMSWLLLVDAGLYAACNLGVSAAISVRKGLRLLPVLPAVFGVIHLAYGSGYLIGAISGLLRGGSRGAARDLASSR